MRFKSYLPANKQRLLMATLMTSRAAASMFSARILPSERCHAAEVILGRNKAKVNDFTRRYLDIWVFNFRKALSV